MQVKDMFLRNEKYLLNILVIVFYLFAFKANSASEDKAEALNYLSFDGLRVDKFVKSIKFTKYHIYNFGKLEKTIDILKNK